MNSNFTKTTKNFSNSGIYYDAMAVCPESIAEELWEKLDNKTANPKPTSRDEDIYNIFVGVNIWCNLFGDVCDESPNMLLNRIRLIGLQNAIKEADDYRLYLISEAARGNFSPYWDRYFPYGRMWTNRGEDQSVFERKWKDCLSTLGCLRKIRISCLDYSFMEEEFLQTNEVCKNFNSNDWIDIGDITQEELQQALGAGSVIPNICLDKGEKDRWVSMHPYCGDRVLDDLAEIIALIFADYKRDDNLFTLPPGASYEGAHTYLEKFKIVEAEQVWLREHGVNIPYSPWELRPEDRRAKNAWNIPASCSRYITVPKSYKTGRGVAPEPVSRQVFGYQVSSGMRKCLKKVGIDLNDQTRNQAFCQVAGLLGLATVDKSSASDLIALKVVEHLFKFVPNLLHDLMECRSEWVKVAGKKIRSNRAFTMGNAVTFDVETSIFLAVSIYAFTQTYLYTGIYCTPLLKLSLLNARKIPEGFFGDDDLTSSVVTKRFDIRCKKDYLTEFCSKYRVPCVRYGIDARSSCTIPDAFSGRSKNPLAFIFLGTKKWSLTDIEFVIRLAQIAVYGDDVILPEACFGLYVEICEKLGFRINYDKSYAKGFSYRESCGVEFITIKNNSYDVTGSYYPRGTSRKALPELLGLQHKYYMYPSVDYFVTSCILDVFPDMTTSEIPDPQSDEQPFDIWTQVPHKVFSDEEPSYGKIYHRWDMLVEYTYCKRELRYSASIDVIHHLTKRISMRLDGNNSIDISLIKKMFTDEVGNGNGTLRLKSMTHYSNELVPLALDDVTDNPDLILGEIHAVVDSEPTGEISKADADRVERLMMLLTLGNGIEHINSSAYTDPEDYIRDRRDLVGKRKIQVTFKTRF